MVIAEAPEILNYIGKTCPYCQFPLKADSEVVECRACKVPCHQECWQENGDCTTFGCREITYQSAAAYRLEISFDETSGRESALARGGGNNKLLVAALVTTLLALVVVGFAYLNLFNNKEETTHTYAPTVIADLDADYYIDYENGTIPIGDLPIGARVVDPNWEWEYRLGSNYSDRDWDVEPTPPGEIKPVNWIIVAHNHYVLDEAHVTLLSEELVGRYTFDDSTLAAMEGINHWGECGSHSSAKRGLRPWLNSTGIHSGEGFYRAFSKDFKRAVLTTTVPNREWEAGRAYSTSDNVFIPSTTELGDNKHAFTYQIGEVYTYFLSGENKNRSAMMVGNGWQYIVQKMWGEDYQEIYETYRNKWFYFTRSPDLEYDSVARLVSYDGDFYIDYYIADYNGNIGVRPALNLKADVLVTEISN